MIAVILSAVVMLFYIWWRFEWFFALGAIATLILDTTKDHRLFRPDTTRLQPDRHCRAADHYRLFGERQGGSL